MATPTLSMRIAGQRLREDAMKQRRSEAAKKAWRTRRRRAKPTPHMRKVLEFLASSPGACLSEHYTGKWLYHAGMNQINPNGTHGGISGRRLRVTVTTLRSLKSRKWLEYVRRRDSGGIMGDLPDGTRGIVEPTFDLDYRISDKGRKALRTK